jgi:tetratricopeptide (TPR) repeat protein
MIRKIIQLNNEGVRCLDAGNHERARDIFKVALQRTTQVLIGRAEPTQEAKEMFLYNHRNAIERVPISPMPIHPEDEPGRTYVFSYALTLNEDCPQLDVSAPDYCLRETIVIMFNLALVHHWRGINLQVSSLLPKALKLYEMALNLVKRSQFPETNLILLGLLNNCGQIHHELAQYNQSSDCFKSLKDLLVAGAANSVDDKDVQDGFLLNLLFLDAPQNAAAA